MYEELSFVSGSSTYKGIDLSKTPGSKGLKLTVILFDSPGPTSPESGRISKIWSDPRAF